MQVPTQAQCQKYDRMASIIEAHEKKIIASSDETRVDSSSINPQKRNTDFGGQ